MSAVGPGTQQGLYNSLLSKRTRPIIVFSEQAVRAEGTSGSLTPHIRLRSSKFNYLKCVSELVTKLSFKTGAPG